MTALCADHNVLIYPTRSLRLSAQSISYTSTPARPSHKSLSHSNGRRRPPEIQAYKPTVTYLGVVFDKITGFARNKGILKGVKLPSIQEAASILAYNLHQTVVYDSNPSLLLQARKKTRSLPSALSISGMR